MTKDGVGIYEALGKCIYNDLTKLLKTDAFKVVPKELFGPNSHKFIFTVDGYDFYVQNQRGIIYKYIDSDRIIVKELHEIKDKIIYKDDYFYILK